MRVYQIIGSIGLQGNRKVERVGTNKKPKHSKLEDCGFSKKQQAHILAIMSEMKDYNTTC